MRYFEHDTDASLDTGVSALRLECGGAAVDAFWAILEMMYEEEGPLELLPEKPKKTKVGTESVRVGYPIKTKVVSARLLTTPEELIKWVLVMVEIGLFYTVSGSKGAVFSKRAETNIEAYRLKQETARQNGKKGGRKPKEAAGAKTQKNQGGTKVACKRKANKKEKDIGFDKQNLYPLKGDSGALESAEPPKAKRRDASFKCPECGELLFKNNQTGALDCPGCFKSFRVPK